MAVKLDARLVGAADSKTIKGSYRDRIAKIHDSIVSKTCLGSEMLGWFDYPAGDLEPMLERVKALADAWKRLGIECVAIAGIGGSYTGIKAILDFVRPKADSPVEFVYFNSLSANNLDLLDGLRKKNWALIVISKSGTTLETSINFRILREALAKKYKAKHRERVIAITDPRKGVLKELSDRHGYATLPIYPDIGGRFSTITPVGLLPAALANVDVRQIIEGARRAKKDLATPDLAKNTAYLYAAYRHFLYIEAKYDIENVMVYEQNLEYLCVQHRQLFGESEGKNRNSLYPTYSVCTTDLHSMGQLFQEGRQIFFETVFKVARPFADAKLKKSPFENDDGLDYLENSTLSGINGLVCEAVNQAHHDAGVNILQLTLDDMSAFTFGYVYYWLSIATTASALLLGHNPFNQPGVQAYKALMFKMLGKK